MPNPTEAPFGTWLSPITSELVASAAINLVDVLLDGGDVYWVEGRPQEAGRNVLVRQNDDGTQSDITALPFSARTRVHEYGGAAALVADGVSYFSDFKDQRLYRVDGSGSPVPLTPPPAPGDPHAALRYADGQIDSSRRLWIGVREDHRRPGKEAANTIVALNATSEGAGTVLIQGHDFFASPRLSPDGRRLAWLAWDHPQMPWVGTELWVAEFDGATLQNPTRIAGGPGESVFQPEWSPDGVLHFVSDRSGWWNIYRAEANGSAVNVCPKAAEFGRPQWNLGMSTYAFLSAKEAVCAYVEGGLGKLALLDLDSGRLTGIDLPYSDFSSVRAQGGKVAFKAGGPALASAIVLLDPRSGEAKAIRKSGTLADDPAINRHFAAPQPIEFPTPRGQTAFGLFYPPTNADHRAPDAELPPLLVRCHGGPTSSASIALDLRTQFWTSRGIAVVDVDYGGSTGYGRAYRERLHRMWGVVDVEDCAAAAQYLADREWVDASRIVISGSSAGGFTVLSCLSSGDPSVRGLFRAGGSHYGVSDPEALARDTHKFESRYLDWLIAPYTGPDGDRGPYLERSPVRNADRLTAPVAFFQGAEDKIVPPSQTESMVTALRQKGITAQYLLFAGEQHGFRQSSNIRWALDAEFYFFSTLVFRTHGAT
ncbi:prolyl oligopeptidase family serine peptidase [Variovorax sp. J2P1-59]|uniref:S9 family peptidase n=1 Tax=Variovorax flavidus TaxID=3053501 RepID=UPI00257878EE|nr:prolyl oligopeptidase family serine peptidase [Variovorax sp. J2P1-59]MDM0073294.1 prolyl oligopeptidase family serine peptidase [Variovorax sp. J2P1-59]